MTRYELSEKHLIRAEQTIPLGSQTFSKSRTQYPVGVSPLYIDRARGSHVWDIDGNKYIDLVSSLASVTLGYKNRKIQAVIRKQLHKGIIFSLPGILEAEVAEMICELVPSAEMVRFGKNGTDATSAAVRLARAYTRKNRVLVCGYHGWQDWFIGSTSRNKGVPKTVSDLTQSFEYNDIDSFRKAITTEDIACVVMEPMNVNYPKEGFLEEIREVTLRLGIVLIFDETITGFRFSSGGAQELFGVIPDLSTFGKGLANGFPLSAVTGKKEIMMEMENIFFSGTFGGELLSLSSAKEVLRRHLNNEVCRVLSDIGLALDQITNEVINHNNLSDILNTSGHPTWKFLNWNPTDEYDVNQLKTFFLQECFNNGLIVMNSHNVTLAHSRKILNNIGDIYSNVLKNLKEAVATGTLGKALKVEPIVPLFTIRK
jgi:glutamate-1-semialdehyde 2,1-aminomutase